MTNNNLNLLSTLKDLQATSSTLIEVALVLEDLAHTTDTTLENGAKIRKLKVLASDCRKGSSVISRIL